MLSFVCVCVCVLHSSIKYRSRAVLLASHFLSIRIVIYSSYPSIRMAIRIVSFHSLPLVACRDCWMRVQTTTAHRDFLFRFLLFFSFVVLAMMRRVQEHVRRFYSYNISWRAECPCSWRFVILDK